MEREEGSGLENDEHEFIGRESEDENQMQMGLNNVEEKRDDLIESSDEEPNNQDLVSFLQPARGKYV